MFDSITVATEAGKVLLWILAICASLGLSMIAMPDAMGYAVGMFIVGMFIVAVVSYPGHLYHRYEQSRETALREKWSLLYSSREFFETVRITSRKTVTIDGGPSDPAEAHRQIEEVFKNMVPSLRLVEVKVIDTPRYSEYYGVRVQDAYSRRMELTIEPK